MSEQIKRAFQEWHNKHVNCCENCNHFCPHYGWEEVAFIAGAQWQASVILSLVRGSADNNETIIEIGEDGKVHGDVHGVIRDPNGTYDRRHLR